MSWAGSIFIFEMWSQMIWTEWYSMWLIKTKWNKVSVLIVSASLLQSSAFILHSGLIKYKNANKQQHSLQIRFSQTFCDPSVTEIGLEQGQIEVY